MKRKTPARRKAKSRAVAIHKPQPPAVPQSDAQAFLAMIERASRDPKIDVAKLKELLAIRDSEQERIARQAFSVAMVACQDGMLPVRRNIQADRFKYASLEAVDDALRPIYSREGFALTFDSAPIDGQANRLRIFCDVMHRTGHTRRYSIPITVTTTGPKGAAIMTQTQGEGAAVSFGRRYLELMIFNIITTEDEVAMQPETATRITDAQLFELNELAQKGGANVEAFCAYIGTDKLINLPASKFEQAKGALLDKIRAMGGTV